jgi:hypothetical protein
VTDLAALPCGDIPLKAQIDRLVGAIGFRPTRSAAMREDRH